MKESHDPKTGDEGSYEGENVDLGFIDDDATTEEGTVDSTTSLTTIPQRDALLDKALPRATA